MSVWILSSRDSEIKEHRSRWIGWDGLILGTYLILYYGVAHIGLYWPRLEPIQYALWPAAGIAVAALLHLGPKAILPLLIIAVLAARRSSLPLDVSLLVAMGQVSGSFFSYLYLKNRPGRGTLESVRDVSRFILNGAVLPAAWGSWVGTAAVFLPKGYWSLNLMELWITAWAGDALGIIILTPFLYQSMPVLSQLRRRRHLTRLLLALGIATILAIAIFRTNQVREVYLIYPILVWIGLSLRFSGVLLANFLIAGIAIWGTAQGLGPFAAQYPLLSTLELQLFLGITAGAFLFLAASATERYRAQKELIRANQSLERHVQERTAALESANHSLKRGQAQLAFALEAADMTMFSWDISDNGLSRQVNSQGYDLDQVRCIERTVRSVHPDDRSHFLNNLSQALKGGQHYQSEHRVIMPDGQVRWILDKGRIEYDSFDRPSYLYGIATDITERKHIEEQLGKAKQAAELASEAKSVFLASMSHEMRTPLSAIVGFAQLILEPRFSTQEKIDFAQRIVRNGMQLTTLINDILDLAKVESSRIDIDRIAVALPELLYDVRDLLNLKAKEKGIMLCLRAASCLPQTLIGDPLRIKQILINLLSNAIKFTPQGYVELSVEASLIEQKAGHWQLIFRVKDTGIGLTEEQQGRLFKAFSQADHHIAREYGGSGLGLVLSRRLAEAMGGRLDLEHSALGQGSCFVLTLHAGQLDDVPFVALDPVGDAHRLKFHREDGEVDRLKDRHILIVDDAPDNRALVRFLLQLAGAEIFEAGSGPEALAFLKRQPFDLVLMDLQMPGLSGYETLELMRKNNLHLPVIALTAQAMKGERENCLMRGFDDYLTKPIDRQLLVHTIRKWTPSPIGRREKRMHEESGVMDFSL